MKTLNTQAALVLSLLLVTACAKKETESSSLPVAAPVPVATALPTPSPEPMKSSAAEPAEPTAPAPKKLKKHKAEVTESEAPVPAYSIADKAIPLILPPPETVAEAIAPREVKRALASVTPEPAEDIAPPTAESLARDFWIWIGGGVNYTSYTQSIPGFSDVSYGKIKTLSKNARAGFFLTDQFGVDLSYSGVPGEVSRSSSITVTNGTYDWRTMSGDLIFRTHEASPWLFRLGFRQQEMPFLVPLSANSLTVSQANLSSATIGVEYRKKRKNVRIEYSLQYMHPLSASADLADDFDMKPKISLSGAIGAAYEFRPNLYVGAQWGLQYESNSFSYKNRTGTAFSGNQTVFSSSMELRAGVEF